MSTYGNIFSEIGDSHCANEKFDELLTRPGLRIERIISTGQVSPPDFWYDQPDCEWVILLKGEAHLLIENEAQARIMRPGDWMDIPAHCRHRVEWTSPEQQTVWLAVHYSDNAVRPPTD